MYAMFYMMVIYIGSTLGIARIFKVQVLEVDIFKGPIKKQYKVDGFIINCRTIPINSSILFLEKENLEADAARPEVRRPGYKAIDEAKIPQQAIIALAGCLGIALIALPILGPTSLIHNVTHGLHQIFAGGFSPCSSGQEYLKAFFAIYESSIFSAFAILGTKQIAFNLIPVFGTPVHLLFSWPILSNFKNTLAAKISKAIGVFFIFIAGALLIGWAIAIAAYSIPSANSAICG